MKTKRILSLLLSFILLIGIMTVPAYAEESTINVSLTLSRYGEIVLDKDNNPLAMAEIELTGKAQYTLDDVFKAAHIKYYEDGADGYLSGETDWGLSVLKLWGDTSGNFGYQINRGSESVMGPLHVVKDGDCIDAYIMTYYYEGYSYFDKYSADISKNQNVEFTLSYISGYDYNNNYEPIISPCAGAAIIIDGEETEYKTDENGKAEVLFDIAGIHVVSAKKTQIISDAETTAITAPVCVVTVYPDASITIPCTSSLFVGQKTKNYIPFTEIEPAIVQKDADTATYYFDITNNKQYNYRVSGENHLTYTGIFKKTAGYTMSIDNEALTAGGTDKKVIDRNTSGNNGYNVGDIYLNINPQGFLKLNSDETYQLVNLRNWEAVDNTSNNYFIEPDYHYTVLDENGNSDNSVIEISEDGIIIPQKSGTAIVLVTYDAFNNVSAAGGPLFGAIWPENTGVFVVGVGLEDSGISANMTINAGLNSSDMKMSKDAIDAEHDVIYFTGDTGAYTFTPETEDCTVSVANPTVSASLSFTGFVPVEMAEDNSFSVPLKEGRNIVKIEKDGKAEYQVITAKEVTVTINKGEAVKAGDTLSIAFDKMYHPANKLASVYNMSAFPLYREVSGYDSEQIIGGTSSQYTFASNSSTYTIENILKKNVNNWGMVSYTKESDLTVPEDYPYDTFYLSGGSIFSTGYGDPYGNHRGITLEAGKDPNFTASIRDAYLGMLPDIEIPIAAPDGELLSITLSTDGVKTEYIDGDVFDASNLVVTAIYEGDKQQIATNYTIIPQVLAEDTEKVVVTYRGQTAEIPVTVKEDKVNAVTIKTNPSKVSYQSGQTFDPTGMIVEALYNSGKNAETYDYTYEPKRALNTGDTQIVVSYTGADADENVLTAIVPITVTSSEGGSSSASSKITVYFTLYGDEKHGSPSDDADTHTLTGGNLTLWLARTAIEVESGSYVIDVVEKALGLNGIPYSNSSGTYIESIKGLGEFDNGSLSGWMYTLNGNYPSLGVADQVVQSGDKIVFHYTDDYTKEKSSVVYNASYTAGGTGNTTADEDADEENTELSNDTDNSQSSSDEAQFSDITEDAWYYEDVKAAVEAGLFNGTNENSFSPNNPMTRGMLVTVLYRYDGGKGFNNKADYADCKENEWYSDAVYWASENGIVNGYGNGVFGTADFVTRQQAVTILYRYAGVKTEADLSSFSDAEEIAAWAEDAFAWAVENKIIFGTDNNELNPGGFVTRAEMAAILMRYLNMLKK